MERVRIDRWLWSARFFKTRGAATDAVAGGHVKVNGARAKPAKDVGAEDVVEVTKGQTTWTIVVRGVAERRGSAKVAAALYDETPESAEQREQRALERRFARALGADLGARPTKQARRRLEALRRSERRSHRGGNG
jgi:ribosome-associated heat shock protein Hsp15